MKHVGNKYQALGEVRKVMEWKFYRHHELTDGQPVFLLFEVKMVCPGRSAWSEGKRIKFVVEAADGPVKHRLDGDDLYDLYDQAEAIAQGIKAIEWKPMIYVKTRTGDGPYNSIKGAEISIGYSLIELGTRRKEKCWRTQGEKSARNIHQDWPETGKDDDENMAALIDDTPEHREKLDALIVGIDKISSRIKELMAPKKILETLSRIDPSRALPFFQQPSNGEHP